MSSLKVKYAFSTPLFTPDKEKRKTGETSFVSPDNLFSLVAHCAIQVEHVPVTTQKQQGCNARILPSKNNHSSRNNQTNDEQGNKHDVDNSLVNLFVVHFSFLFFPCCLRYLCY